MHAQEAGIDGLFKSYINVVNRALAAHKDEAPYKQLLQVGERLTEGKTLGVEIYKTEPREPHHYYALKFINGKLWVTDTHKVATDVDLKVNDRHLREVVEDPETYVEHPAQLDLSWLRTRLATVTGQG